MSTTLTHGTRWAYDRHKCRCLECSRAHNDYQREWRAANAQSNAHGHPEGKPYTVHTYSNLGCRCTLCREANAAHQRAYYARKKAEATNE